METKQAELRLVELDAAGHPFAAEMSIGRDKVADMIGMLRGRAPGFCAAWSLLWPEPAGVAAGK
ncbi:MAG: hypothetical protein LBO00_05865 [Zoogloeaceae bacterium]|jgi:hypothetical protein|nr:hypothetical protein [Zoogloeaceae bacterium]